MIFASIVMDHFCQQVGFLIETNGWSQYWPTNAEVEDLINEVFVTSSSPKFYSNSVQHIFKVKAYGMAGVGLSNINMENNAMHGNFARMVAELLYL